MKGTISNDKFGVKYNMIKKKEKNDRKLVIFFYSQTWTAEMHYIYEICKNLGIDFLWLFTGKSNKKEIYALLKKQNVQDFRNIHLITQNIKDHVNTPVMYQMLKLYCEKNVWFLRLDNDEIISAPNLLNMQEFIKDCNQSVTFGIGRIWINKINNQYYFSKIAKTIGQKYDIVYRLFKLKNVRPVTGMHSGGVGPRVKHNYNLSTLINHHTYLNENLESRINKIKRYEDISSGAGLSKLRHYLPEIYPSNIWEKLDLKQTRLEKDFELFKKLAR
jgi:hypothetical protein